MSALKQLRLVNFRSLKDFTVSFGEGAYLVGPNNAGKSTILTALRVADVLVRFAHRRRSEGTIMDLEIRRATYPVILRDFPALQDSLRFEFGSAEARLELEWKDGAKLTAVWPEENGVDEADPFFYLQTPEGLPVRAPNDARATIDELGIIPILGPVEQTEKLRADEYVKLNIAGRLSSRHFRNQMRLLKQAELLESFFIWAEPWIGELTFDQLTQNFGEDGAVLQLFFYEQDSRVPKETVWLGDGIQVWLQLLYHLHRVRDFETIILDEPEVYLHPDLQRRLVRLLEATGRQIIVATHSAEMVAESDGRLTVLVDKSRRRASRPRSEADFEMLSETLGTAFNLRLARALRSRVAVFVEGRDMVVLRHFARTLGLNSLAGENGITVIPLGGYSNWGQVEPFKWLCEELLPNAIRTFVILDRDYRTDSTCSDVVAKFEVESIHAHIWQRKELESYLLTPSVIARLSGLSSEDVIESLDTIAQTMEGGVFSRLLNERIQADSSATNHAVSITTSFKQDFDVQWGDPAFRLAICPPKQVLSQLNTALQSRGHRTVSIAGLARAHRRSEIAEEMADTLREIESAIS